jgi:hypothetical protein
MAPAVHRNLGDPVSTGEGDIARIVLMEPGISDPAHYGRRVRWLAAVHFLLFVVALVGFALLVWRATFFITLAQRTNVETLTITFFLLFFAYFAVVTAPGAYGALRIASKGGNERRKQSAIEKRPRVAGASAAFDRAIELAGKPGEPFNLELRDGAGSLGRVHVSGVKAQHVDAFRGGSNTLLGYVERHLSKVSGQRISVVQWGATAEEEVLQLVAISDALRAIGKKLEIETWPTVVLTEEQRQALEDELGKLCPALRNEAMLPDWEFEGEHKLPIIPEPLGIISLSRTEKRVDPLSAMTAVLTIVAIVVALITFFIVRPPWMPGR